MTPRAVVHAVVAVVVYRRCTALHTTLYTIHGRRSIDDDDDDDATGGYVLISPPLQNLQIDNNDRKNVSFASD